MGRSPSPGAAEEVKRFLDALANDGLLMAWYLTNRQAAITGWFDEQRAERPDSTAALDEAEQIILSGNVPAIRAGLESSGASPSVWVTGWVTGGPHT